MDTLTLHDTAILAAVALVALAVVFVPLGWVRRKKRLDDDDTRGGPST